MRRLGWRVVRTRIGGTRLDVGDDIDDSSGSVQKHKIEWDQPSRPPYLDELEVALYGMPSLDAALRVYCDYLWEHRESQFVAHPWFVDVSRSMEQV